MDNRHDLNVILSSRVPIVVVETLDEKRFLGMLVDLARGAFGGRQKPLFRWSVTEGLQRLDIDMAPQSSNTDPAGILKHILAVEAPGIYALLDFHPYLNDPVNVRLLKDIAVGSANGERTVVLVSHELQAAARTRTTVGAFRDRAAGRQRTRDDRRPAPSRNGMRRIPGRVAGRPAGRAAAGPQPGRADAGRHRAARARRRSSTTARSRPAILPDVMQAKYELLNRQGVLTFEYEIGPVLPRSAVCVNLKRWLEQRQRPR